MELTNQVLSTSDVKFKCNKERIVFLYPNLDLSLLDFLKAMRDGVLVDEETMASSRNIVEEVATQEEE